MTETARAAGDVEVRTFGVKRDYADEVDVTSRAVPPDPDTPRAGEQDPR